MFFKYKSLHSFKSNQKYTLSHLFFKKKGGNCSQILNYLQLKIKIKSKGGDQKWFAQFSILHFQLHIYNHLLLFSSITMPTLCCWCILMYQFLALSPPKIPHMGACLPACIHTYRRSLRLVHLSKLGRFKRLAPHICICHLGWSFSHVMPATPFNHSMHSLHFYRSIGVHQ